MGRGREGEGRRRQRPNHIFWLRHRGEGLRDRNGKGEKGEGREGGNWGYCLQLLGGIIDPDTRYCLVILGG